MQKGKYIFKRGGITFEYCHPLKFECEENLISSLSKGKLITIVIRAEPYKDWLLQKVHEEDIPGVWKVQHLKPIQPFNNEPNSVDIILSKHIYTNKKTFLCRYTEITIGRFFVEFSFQNPTDCFEEFIHYTSVIISTFQITPDFIGFKQKDEKTLLQELITQKPNASLFLALGNAFLDEKNSNSDSIAEGIKNLKIAAILGEAGAQAEISNYYQKGVYVPKDPQEAQKWFRHTSILENEELTPQIIAKVSKITSGMQYDDILKLFY